MAALRSPPSPSSVAATAVPQITLSEKEKELFQLLNAVASADGAQTTLRVAGGWVRDKVITAMSASPELLGGLDGGSAAGAAAEKSDIDIALDDQLGAAFAERVNAWLEASGDGSHEATNTHTIQKNPDKSKHLETATMMVRGFAVDFVNLRTEEYCDTSRIPTVGIGTPREDALRRDLTINALFYNLRTGGVEDHTGRGLHDLAARVAATPLPPLVTLLDDPLRLLRAVRFACRLGFTLDGALLAAARDPAVGTPPLAPPFSLSPAPPAEEFPSLSLSPPSPPPP